jgi:hypothetical protein
LYDIVIVSLIVYVIGQGLLVGLIVGKGDADAIAGPAVATGPSGFGH